MRGKILIAGVVVPLFLACSSMYFAGMEKLGVHKREIMVDRVKAARDTQNEAKEQFLSAMGQFKSVVAVQGGDLEEKYEKLSSTLEKSENEAAAVRKRIKSVEEVSEALFTEWSEEIKQYNSESLKKASQRKYDQAKTKYAELMKAMKKAESKLEPDLIPLRYQVLFIKHNLNAKAIAGLSDELISVQSNVDTLVHDMEVAIAEADKFIAALQEE